MAAALGLVYFVFWQSGCALGLTILCGAMLMIASSLSGSAAGGYDIMVVLLTVSIPLAGYLGAILVERFIFVDSTVRRSMLGTLGTLLGVLLLCSGVVLNNLFEAIALLMRPQTVGWVTLLLTSINAIIVGASMVAVALMLVCLITELPIRLLGRTAGFHFVLPFGVLRLWLALVIFALSSQLVIGLFESELGPLAILRRAIGN